MWDGVSRFPRSFLAVQPRQDVAVGVSPRYAGAQPLFFEPRRGDTGGAIMAGTYTNLLFHIVFSTKERRQLIVPAIEDDLRGYLGGIVKGLEGKLLEVNGASDHVHILAKLPPKLAVSDAVRDIKANSSKWLNEQKSKFYKFGWQDGIAAFSVSESQVDRVRGYIRNQKQRHKRMTFQDELLALLEKHRVQFDRR